MEDDNSIAQDIKDKLDDLSKKIVSNNHEMKKLANQINNKVPDVYSYKSSMSDNNKENAKEIFKRVICGVGAVGIIVGTVFFANLVSETTKYKTTREVFSTLSGYTSEENYDTKVNDEYKDTKLYVYEPYEKTRYDYLELNLEHAANRDDNYQEKKSNEMSEDDFYDEVIYEIVKVVQDEEDLEIISSKVGFLGLWILFTILAEIFYLIVIGMALDSGYELASNFSDRDGLKKCLISMKNKIEAFRKLADNNNDVRAEFSRLYSGYKPLIESGEFQEMLDEMNNAVLIEDPQMELDKRTKRLLKTKIK